MRGLRVGEPLGFTSHSGVERHSLPVPPGGVVLAVTSTGDGLRTGEMCDEVKSYCFYFCLMILQCRVFFCVLYIQMLIFCAILHYSFELKINVKIVGFWVK